MASILRTLRTAALLATAALALTAGNAQQVSVPVPATQPPAASTLTFKPWNPMLDEMHALPSAQRNLSKAQVSFPMSSAASVPFGGFRVAPSTPAHAPGDVSSELAAVRADFNHDGCQDIVSFQVNTLTVLNGDCKGGFTNAGSQATAIGVYSTVAVDLNHDGYPDIVAMTYPFAYLGTVVTLLNQKDGTFSAPTVISQPASVYSGLMSMNVYDINGDGNPDVVISGAGTVDTQTYTDLVFETIFGNGDGSFNTASLVETDGTLPNKPVFAFGGGTALHLFNGQLYLYALINQSQRQYAVTFASEQVFRWPVAASGKVDLSKPQVIDFPVANNQPNKYLNFADLNRDGVDDLTVLNGDGMLYTAIGAADGTFAPFKAALPFYAGNSAATILFKDANGDGKVDAIIAGGVFLGVWPGNGDGTFRAPATTYLGGFASNSTQGLTFPVSNHILYDFDGDGVPDVAFFDTAKRALNFYKGKPDGTLIGAPALVNTTGAFAGNTLPVLATPDLNGDGIKDVVVNSFYGVLSGIADGKGNYTWQMLAPQNSVSALSAYTADFDKDGREDVIFISQDRAYNVHLWIGFSNGDGTVTAREQILPFQSTFPFDITIGDIDGDGYPDLALALNDYGVPSYGVWPMLNDRKGKLSAGTYLDAVDTVYGVALADVDKDGKADLVLSHGSYSATSTEIHLSTGATGFSAAPASTIQNTLPGGPILMTDLNRDGKLDAVLTVTNGDSEGLMLYNGNGDGTFGAGVSLVTGLVPTYVGATDLNLDGLPDLYFTQDETVLTDANDTRFGLVVLMNAGGGAFAAPLHYNIYGASSPVLPVDPLQTGSPSLYATSGASATTFLHNNGSTRLNLTTTSASLTTATATTATLNVAAFFSDQAVPTGYADLLVDGIAAGHQPLAANGSAVFNVASLPAGTHLLTAAYEGDGTYNMSTHSGSVSISVTKAVPLFSLAADSGILSLTQTGSTSTQLSLTANNAFSGPVSLTCLGAPKLSTCSFSQSSVTLAPGQAVKVTMTLASTTSASLQSVPIAGGGGVALCGMLLLLPFVRRRRFAGLVAGFAAGLAALVVAVGLGGCSSTASPVLSPGTYAVTVNAAAADPTIAPQAVTLTVTVK